jgi:WD40 repeat protein
VVGGSLRAIKVVSTTNRTSPESIQQEIEGVRRFQEIHGHLHQVQILHSGRLPGGFYYVMEAADATAPSNSPNQRYQPRTLAVELHEQKRLAIHDCLRIGVALASALGHLHRHGLVHRDVKPSNILYIGGVVKLADIGLVTLASENPEGLGTPGYTPRNGANTAQADIFALGKVLYELATGLDRTQFPSLPTATLNTPDRLALLELNEVLLRACDPDPGRRDRSAEELQSDLERLLAGLSMIAARLQRNLTRTRTVGWISFLAASVLAAAVGYLRHRGNIESDLIRQLTLSNYARTAEQGDTLTSLLWAVQSLERSESSPPLARSDRLRIGTILQNIPTLESLWLHEGPIRNALFLADDRHVLTAGVDGHARLWDMHADTPDVAGIRHNAEVEATLVSPDSRWIATSTVRRGTTNEVRLTELRQPGLSRSLITTSGPVRSVEFSPNGSWIAAASDDGTARVWEVETGTPVCHPLLHGGPVRVVDFAPAGNLLLTCSWDGTARLWQLPEGREACPPVQHTDYLRHAAFSPDGRSFVTSCDDGVARLWSTESPPRLLHFFNHSGRIRRAAFSPDGLRVATASDDRTARVWDVATGKPLGAPLVHPNAVNRITFHPGGRLVATASADHCARVWDWQSGQLATPLLRHNGLLSVVDFDHSGERLLTTGEDGIARLWRLPPHLIFHGLEAPTPDQRFAGFSEQDGKYLLLQDDKTLAIASLHDPSWRSSPIRHQAPILSACLSPDAQRLITTGEDGAAHLWKTADATEACPPARHSEAVTHGIFDLHHPRIATGSTEGSVRVWSAHDASLLADLPSEGSTVRALAFFQNPDHLLAAYGRNADLRSSSSSGSVVLWSLRSASPAQRFNHGGAVRWACPSPDERKILSVGDGNMGRLWETATGFPVSMPLIHSGRAFWVAFGSDDRQVYSASQNTPLRRDELSSASGTLQEIRDLATLLAGRRLLPGGELASLEPSELKDLWQAHHRRR